MSPSADTIAGALAGRDKTRLQPAGAYAANMLGLSEQVPAKAVFLPADRTDLVDADLALRMMRAATRWYAVPGQQRFDAERRRGRERRPVDKERQAQASEQLNQFTLPAETALIRRMHVIVNVVLGQLRAGADWGAIAAEYLHGGPPATALGEAEAAHFAAR